MVQFCSQQWLTPAADGTDGTDGTPAGALPMAETGRDATTGAQTRASCSTSSYCFIDLPALIQSDGTAADLSSAHLSWCNVAANTAPACCSLTFFSPISPIYQMVSDLKVPFS